MSISISNDITIIIIIITIICITLLPFFRQERELSAFLPAPYLPD